MFPIPITSTESSTLSVHGAKLPALCLARDKIPSEAEEPLPNRRGNVCVTLKKKQKKAEERKFIYIQKFVKLASFLFSCVLKRALEHSLFVV